MRTDGQSLRWLVHKWFGSAPASGIRVTRTIPVKSNPFRGVCVETIQSDRDLVIFFFRHDDGSWSVLPPSARRPMFSVCV